MSSAAENTTTTDSIKLTETVEKKKRQQKDDDSDSSSSDDEGAPPATKRRPTLGFLPDLGRLLASGPFDDFQILVSTELRESLPIPGPAGQNITRFAIPWTLMSRDRVQGWQSQLRAMMTPEQRLLYDALPTLHDRVHIRIEETEEGKERRLDRERALKNDVRALELLNSDRPAASALGAKK